MPRLLRYSLLWLVCTALAVTVGFFAVGFVVQSTTHVPPTAQEGNAVPAVAAVSAPASPSVSATVVASARPSATPSGPEPASGSGRSHPADSGTPEAPPAPRSGGAGCQGGVGAHTINSQGGQASVLFGADAVCLISAVPAPGFTAQTQQPDTGTLVITFCGSGHRSQITAHLSPYPGSMTRETTWSNTAASLC